MTGFSASAVGVEVWLAAGYCVALVGLAYVIDALARSGTPFSVLTKGTVLGRDLPRLSAAAADVPVGLGVSIALLDRELQARLEPGAPSAEARLQLVRRITDAGLPCGVMVAPVLPMLTDSSEALDALLARIADAGATGATVMALHLRPGAREWFQAWLAREYPALVEPYARYGRPQCPFRPPHALRHRLSPSRKTRRRAFSGGSATFSANRRNIRTFLPSNYVIRRDWHDSGNVARTLCPIRYMLG